MEAINSRDLDKILTIDRNAFQQPWHRKSFLEELACENAYGYAVKTQRVDHRTEIIAYAFLRVLLTEMHILRLAVAAEFQAIGVASWLLQQCFSLAKQKKVYSVYIEVRPTNKTAIALYRKSGFQLLAKRPAYYPETGEDALVMVKHLKENL
jgi:ribosomal-protein-alanine N-acetyltransferase